ncbi:MAG: histidinol-phosphatase HisJ family protein [Lachnospiraceae bacterium]|nr:histidinol-phosphatase HisJ family protein [Erysipelotrichaceae bacterium]MBR2544620.1 histidinol-phosphatase HisJ family protein [Erysipelotrichaceae bacterium]MBR4341956.1 histidinol-phosphatase HisJ family protein [Lachnospiraceae bacterium]
MLVDYHVHSEFSDDSRESMEKQIEKAIELGFDEICFTDHVDYGIKKDWAEGNIEWRGGDGISSSADKLDPLSNVNYMEYFGKILRMKETYKGKIQIKSGLEFGVQSITIPQYEELWARWNNVLDFALLSMHQVNNQEFWTQEFQQGKTQKQYNEEYYEEILKVIRQYKHYSVLAHLDLIVRYDKQGVYPFDKVKDLIAEILRTAIADGKGIEINTSSWHYGLKDTQPSRDILKLYKDLGGKIITIGSDAHNTSYLGDHIEEARKILRDEIGFEQFCTFDQMEPIFHNL